mmetsp:Transcript_45228/g.94868  ORF Transcript_45228/g.94868 Transcript_45228/m.94868 type:complete len:323 (-) Transcript_45228:160-1128(-)
MHESAGAMWYRATILSRKQLSPTVTGLRLRVDPPQPNNDGASGGFTFLPGQWVDFRPLPCPSWKPSEHGRRIIGGYSLTSIPNSLPELDLAIQRSRHPVARWATVDAQQNDLVDIRVGGSFTYKSGFDGSGTVDAVEKERGPSAAATDRLLFVAGGVGINPPYSMIQQWHADQITQNKTNSRAILLYSCRSRENLLFLNELGDLLDEKPDQFRVICTTTKGEQSLDETNGSLRETSQTNSIEFREGRIDSKMIRDAVGWLNQHDNIPAMEKHGEELHGKKSTLVADAVFVCGPPGMPESMMKILSEEKFVQSTDNVHFEKWW